MEPRDPRGRRLGAASLLDRPSVRRAAVFACALAAYSTSLSGPFQFDDLGVIVRYDAVHSLAAFWHWMGGIRPVLKLTYALCWALGLGPLGFHLVNVIVHLVNVDLSMRLYVAATRREQSWPFGGIDGGAAVTGLLFAVHPVQTEAVTYISGRSASLMTSFVLLSLLLYAASARSRRKILYLGLSLVVWVCAVLTKEVSAMLPAGLLLWDLIIERPGAKALFARLGPFMALSLALLVAAILSTSYFTLLYNVLGARPLVDALRYQLAGVAYLGSRLFWVHRLSIDPGLGLRPPDAGLVLLGAGVVTTLAAVVATQLRRRPAVAFGAAWFLVQIFLPYVLMPRLDVVNERHMYVANAGVFMAVGSLAEEFLLPRLGSIAVRVACGAVVAALMAMTVRRNLDYRTARALWESTARVSPSNPRAHYNLGTVYESFGRWTEARDAYARAIVLEPRYTAARRGLARVADRRDP